MPQPTNADDTSILDPELHAFVDGKLSPDRMALVEARLSADGELAQIARDWSDARNLIRAAASAADTAPSDMRTELLARELAARVQRARRRAILTGSTLRQVAASVAIFTAGWLGHATFVMQSAPLAADEARIVAIAAMQPHEGMTELNPYDTSVLASLQSLAPSQGAEINYPDFTKYGLTLASVVVSDTSGQPSLRLYFDTDTGKQLSVVMAKHPQNEPEYRYQVRTDQEHTMAYLTRDGLDYAITGEDDPVMLATLASDLLR